MSARRRRSSSTATPNASTVASKYRYSWTRHYSVDANVAGEIIRKAGTPERVLLQASNPTNPLHDLFEWDDSKAAQEYRLVQCRVMVNSLRVEIIDNQQKPRHITAFIKKSDRVTYVAVPEADKDDLGAAELECWRHMKRFHRKWKDLQFAQTVIASIQSINQHMSRRASVKKRARP